MLKPLIEWTSQAQWFLLYRAVIVIFKMSEYGQCIKKKSGILSSSVARIKANLLDIIALERMPIKLRTATTVLITHF